MPVKIGLFGAPSPCKLECLNYSSDMNAEAPTTPPVATARRNRRDLKEVFEKFAAEYGPGPDGKSKAGKGVPAVDFLIKLRRGES